MRRSSSLTQSAWTLTGWVPYSWKMESAAELSSSPNAEIPPVRATVPGSVQAALRDAQIIPDWNVGFNYRQCQWVENLHWMYETHLPEGLVEPNTRYKLRCLGLDYSGWVFLNGRQVGEFRGSHIPHEFDLTEHLARGDNVLRIVFDTPPRWLGQFGHTSEMLDWKARFNYTWDWTVRLVQIGIWDNVVLVETRGGQIASLHCRSDADPDSLSGNLHINGGVTACDGGRLVVSLLRDGNVVRRDDVSVSQFASSGLHWSGLKVELWWPNLMGEQPLYDLECRLIDEHGEEVDKATRRVGFRSVGWQQCQGASPDADPNLCTVNGRPVFLQGVNWTPIRPNFADVTRADYQKRLSLYKDLGFNLMRVWGGASLERQDFYDLCDEMGLMVWQEFPLSSSGIENTPPSDAASIESMSAIAESYMDRRGHHASLITWCGGNELQGPLGTEFHGKPVDAGHPMIARLKQIVSERDPGRRFFPTSPSGPVFSALATNFGKGIHWHVHGPWKADGDLTEWRTYWENDDSMLRTETGAPGASSAEIIEKYAGDCSPTPVAASNPLWRRTALWWLEREQFDKEHGREPRDLEEYVAWSQARQAEALTTALECCKSRFPKCSGFVIWMGHDCFPCNANTSIVDFEGNPKPAALALSCILRGE